jgi:hypothetical protein
MLISTVLYLKKWFSKLMIWDFFGGGNEGFNNSLGRKWFYHTKYYQFCIGIVQCQSSIYHHTKAKKAHSYKNLDPQNSTSMEWNISIIRLGCA